MGLDNYSYVAVSVALAIGVLVAAVHRFPLLARPSQRPVLLERSLVLAVCAVALLAVYGNFYAETSYFSFTGSDFGTDTSEQYVPYLLNLIDSVRDGSFSVMNLEFDLGVPLCGVQTWTLDPFNLFLVPFVVLAGDSHLSLGLVCAQSLKIVVSALLFDELLASYCKVPATRLLGSVLYGFSGFMVMFGQHYWLGSVYPLFKLTPLMFERYLEGMGVACFLGTSATVFCLTAWSPYIAFMVLLFMAIYLLFRIPVTKGSLRVRAFVGEVGRMCLPVACGLLLSGAFSMPFLHFLMSEATRASSDESLASRVLSALSSFLNPRYLMVTLSRMLGSGLINNGSAGWAAIAASGDDPVEFDAYECIMLGYSVGVFLLLSQFFHWVAAEQDKRDRCLVLVATLMIVLFCVNGFLPLVFTGMVRVQRRCSFILNIPVIVAACIGWEKRVASGKIAWRSLSAAFVLTLFVLVWSFNKAVTSKLSCAAHLVALVTMGAVLVVLRLGKPLSPLALVALMALMVFSSVADAFSYTNLRVLTSKESFPKPVIQLWTRTRWRHWLG